MGKLTVRGPVAKDDPMFSGGPEIFSKQGLISRAVYEAALKNHGLTEAPPDHPIYSEPPSITLLPRMQKPSQPRVIDSHLNDSQSDSASSKSSKK